MAKIKVLHVLGRLDLGGAETMVMNLFRFIDRGQFEFDFAIHTQDECEYSDAVRRLGGKIYSFKPFNASTALSYRRQWHKFFKEHNDYAIVHGHMRSTAVIYLSEASKAGMVTIAHSHNTSSGTGISALVKTIMQYPLRFTADYLLACSNEAGRWLFGKRATKRANYMVLRNGIEPGAFKFDLKLRQEARRMLGGIEAGGVGSESHTGSKVSSEMNQALSAPIFLHIGRLEKQKNHEFLLQIMERILQVSPNAQLLLCGVGPLKEELIDSAKNKGISGNVRFLGARSDVPMLMQGADGIIFPSLFEGLPVTLVEAQAAGLPILASDKITGEIILTDLVKMMPLTAEPGEWAREAIKMVEGGQVEAIGAPAAGSKTETDQSTGTFAVDSGSTAYPGTDRTKYAQIVADQGYDVAQNAKALGEFYKGIILSKGVQLLRRFHKGKKAHEQKE